MPVIFINVTKWIASKRPHVQIISRESVIRIALEVTTIVASWRTVALT